jgi:hypothetical protein
MNLLHGFRVARLFKRRGDHEPVHAHRGGPIARQPLLWRHEPRSVGSLAVPRSARAGARRLRSEQPREPALTAALAPAQDDAVVASIVVGI